MMTEWERGADARAGVVRDEILTLSKAFARLNMAWSAYHERQTYETHKRLDDARGSVLRAITVAQSRILTALEDAETARRSA